MKIIKNNIKLSDFNTFRTGGNARFFCEVKNKNELIEAIKFAKKNKLKFFVIGNGSNLLLSDKDFGGLVIKISIKSNSSQIKSQFDGAGKIESKSKKYSTVSVGAGESTDNLIKFLVKNNLSGIENLWNIPGTVGAGVVQNIGAYGVELKDYIDSVEVIDAKSFKIFTLKNTDCKFGYRDSLFKRNKNLIITKVYLKLSNFFKPNIQYLVLKEYFSRAKILNAKDIIKAVQKIRKNKLPNWKILGTAGSFFKNPFITKVKYQKLLKKYPNLPKYSADKGFIKIPLGFVIDKICRLKGLRLGQVGLYKKQSLVIVNYGGAKFSEINNFAKMIERKVYEKIKIKIEREVESVKF